MPRVKSETIGAGDQTWLGSDKDLFNARSGNLDISAFTANTHYPDGYIKSGTPVGRITAAGATAGKYVPHNSAATNGSEVHVGFVLTDQPTDGVEDINVPILDSGKIKLDNLPIAMDADDVSPHFILVGEV